ncbi:MAG TPA: cyclic nucleotide-binding and patatin-like phospholipase domain-containing protein [Acidimicrobiales bacterium]|nr:cyclic nucleotide-binding and patatin-like phospholipase domain-containing protein [Acidimicrobiales bacterium]
MAGQGDLPELSEFLAGVPFFASLDTPTRLEVARQLEPLYVPAGEVLFRQGDAADSLYLVASGRLRVMVEAEGSERALYDLGRGAVVGELALLTEQPRSASVHVVRDCDLWVLRVTVFRSLLEQAPAVATAMVRMLANWLLAVDRMLTVKRTGASGPASRIIAVAAAGRDPRPAALVARRLADRLAIAGPVVRVDAEMVERSLGLGAAQRRPGEPGRAELSEWLHALERSHDHVVYEADAEDTAWSRVCLSQADVVLLAASAADDPALGSVETRALATPTLRCELVLMHAAVPTGTARWLEGRPVADHHHLRDGQPGDVARLARMITGSGCGLVLGGGGARGFAHLGVLRALEEAGVPIDVVGGVSFGALVAAVCALGMDDAQRTSVFIRNGRRLLVTPTLPVVALSSGRRLDRMLQSDLGVVPIEDLPRRFFCISASLSRADVVVHERGPLWPAVRASVSLPGIFPPVYDGGDLLVDGGTLDILPAALMRSRVGNGCVVAVSVSAEVEPLATVPYGPGLSGWKVFGRRLNPVRSSHPVPGIAEILTRSISLSQVRHRRAPFGPDEVDLLLRPPVGAQGVLDFKSAAPLIGTSYAYACEVLANSGLARRFLS